MSSASKRPRIVRQRNVPLNEILERVMEEGSDEEGDLLSELGDSEIESDSDGGELYIPADDESVDGTDSDTDSHSNGDIEENAATGGETANAAVQDVYNMDTEVDSSSSDSEGEDEGWVRNFRRYPQVPTFTGEPGIQVDLGRDPSPVEVYELFITKNLLKKMKKETNLYAKTAIDNKLRAGVRLSQRSLFKTWTPVTLGEMRIFLSILIHMGLVKKPQIPDYWSTDISLKTDFARRLMGRERFKAILAFWHLNDNADYIAKGQPGHDPIHKVRPLFDHMNETFKAVLTPRRNICIDEAICPWRGRVAFRVYMRDKPTKWGIKLYELCESDSGYVYNFEVMCHAPGISNRPVDVCTRLTAPLRDKGYQLFVDNYYCCPQLCTTMVENKIMVVGTVRANRVGLPKDFMKQPLNPGVIDFRHNKQTVVLRWKDKRDVNLLTTVHTDTSVRTRSQTGNEKEKPKAVVDYINCMAGVDKSDQMISYLPLHRKTVKWWKKLALHFITMVMIQAHIVFNKHRTQHGRRQWQLDDFVRSVCKSMAVSAGAQFENEPGTADEDEDAARAAGPAAVDREAARAPVPNPTRPAGRPAAVGGGELTKLTGRHFPSSIGTSAAGKKKFRECHVCYARARSDGKDRNTLRKVGGTKTNIECKICDKRLCLACFEVYHTVLDYSKV